MIIDKEHKEFYTLTQQEKMYFVTKDNIDNVNKFFTEIMLRKRNDTDYQKDNNKCEGGIQASGLLLSNIGAFKINEDDGLEPHSITHLNLLRGIEYKLDESKPKIYVTKEIGRDYNYYSDDKHKITTDCTELRVICSEDDMNVLFLDWDFELNDFKKEVIYEAAKFSYDMKKKGILLGKINFGYSTRYDYKDYKDFDYDNLLEIEHDFGIGKGESVRL